MPSYHGVRLCLVCALVGLSLLNAASAHAVEGGLDVCAPALNSNLGLAAVPEPGNYFLFWNYYLDGKIDPSVATLTRAPKFGENAFATVL